RGGGESARSARRALDDRTGTWRDPAVPTAERARSMRTIAAAVAALCPLAAPAQTEPDRAARFLTDRTSPIELRLTDEADAFTFVVFGDRTGGPAEGIRVLAAAVDEVN